MGLLAWRSIMVKKPLSRLIKILTGVYGGAESELSRLERFAHLCALVIRSFVRNRCPVRAAALSYTTLLALVPLLAVAIGVTSSLLKNEGEEKIYRAIDKLVTNFVPPATLNTNDQAVSLNLSPGMPVALTPTNAIAKPMWSRPARAIPVATRGPPRKRKPPNIFINSSRTPGPARSA